jgi:HSP20 family protein
MNMRDLIPWGRNAQTTPSPYREEGDPFMTLHPFGSFGGMGRMAGWPSVEVIETDKDVRVSAELPGLDEKDVEVLMSDSVLTLRGEKRSEVEDKDRTFSERTYGRFERRIPLGWDVEEDKVNASFQNGVLTVTMPKSAKAAAKARRIAINRDTKH